MILAVYVDDIIAVGSSKDCESLRTLLSKFFHTNALENCAASVWDILLIGTE